MHTVEVRRTRANSMYIRCTLFGRDVKMYRFARLRPICLFACWFCHKATTPPHKRSRASNSHRQTHTQSRRYLCSHGRALSQRPYGRRAEVELRHGGGRGAAEKFLRFCVACSSIDDERATMLCRLWAHDSAQTATAPVCFSTIYRVHIPYI